MKDFDAIMEAAKPGDTIQLEAGLYSTRGYAEETNPGQRLKKGCQVYGQGNETVIRFIPPHDNSSFTVLGGEGENEAFDFVLDGGAESGLESYSKFKRNLIYFSGDDNHIRNLTFMRPFGHYGNQRECFVVMLLGKEKGSSIHDCRLLDVRGNYVSGFCLQKGQVKNNFVSFPQYKFEPAKRSFYMGINIGEANGVTVSGNTVQYGTAGFYSDWLDVDGVTVTGNTFSHVEYGVLVKRQYKPGDPGYGFFNAKFHQNTILLNPETADQVAGFQLDNTRAAWTPEPIPSNYIRDISITENTVGWPVGTTPIAVTRYFVNMASNAAVPTETLGLQRIEFRDNTLTPDLKWRNRNGKGVTTTKLQKVDDPVQWVT